jgi:DNA-binding LacI/PurR family transcriptional regulator
MNKRPTISDVARVARVSLMSVSRAMNNRPGLSDETRQRILDIADQLGYRPSSVARALATRQTSTIGLVMPDIAKPFFSQIARGAEDSAYENGYNVFLINTAEDPEREKAALDSLWQNEIDGAILCSPCLSQEKLEPYFARFPATVLVNRELGVSIANVATINVDDHLGAQKVVRYFVENGRRRIAFITGPATSVSSQRQLIGYRHGLKAANLAFDPSLVEHRPPTTEAGHAALKTLFSRSPEVDAVFCFNDLVAVGVIQACIDTGRDVPTDVAVIGADDIPLASLVRPALSTLQVDKYQIGHQANSLIVRLLKNDSLTRRTVLIQPEFIIRESA